MFIIAKHAISDPAQFRAIASVASAALPEGVALHQALPNAAGTEQVCLWEAESLEEVQAFVEEKLSHVSTNTYFAVEESSAMGLPVIAG